MGSRRNKTKFIFVTGGVVSSIGKGLASASIGALLENRGLEITLMKLDPYINVDPGTMNPFQHGEVFVTDDGSETDLDLGHYERFTSAVMKKANNLTTGKVYNTVISKERKGEYLGETIQVIPHITDEIKHGILEAASGADVAIVEIGGTVGDIESLPFLEAIRQLKVSLEPTNSVFIHLTLVPFLKAAGEFKTKPTQHSVKMLQQSGIQPDILICRSEKILLPEQKRKIALFCNVGEEAVISAPDVEYVYELPILLQNQGLDERIAEYLNIWSRAASLEEWTRIVNIIKNAKEEVCIAIVGKYVNLRDSYKSLHEALIHGGIANRVKVNLRYLDSEELEKNNFENLQELIKGANGILVPGGFGSRGIEGKIKAIEYARNNNIPFFGICLGMHLAVVEISRNLAGLKGANSTEFALDTPYPVIDFIPEQKNVENKGGTMRLGSYKCKLLPGSNSHNIYRSDEIVERHRHRYEFNENFAKKLSEAGVIFSGFNPDKGLIEMIELKNHPWFIACQFHPEFKSKPTQPHPLFASFINAAFKNKREN